jgi:hypothetical protein
LKFVDRDDVILFNNEGVAELVVCESGAVLSVFGDGATLAVCEGGTALDVCESKTGYSDVASEEATFPVLFVVLGEDDGAR